MELHTLLLGKMDSLLLTAEALAGALHIVGTRLPVSYRSAREVIIYSRTGPSHKRVLPAATTRQDIPVKPPLLALRPSTLHCVPGRLVDTDNAVAELAYQNVHRY